TFRNSADPHLGQEMYHAELFFDRKIGIVDQYGITGLYKRAIKPRGIDVIPLQQILFDILVFCLLSCDLDIVHATTDAGFEIGGEKYFEYRLRKHHRANVPAIHDHVELLAIGLLESYQSFSHIGHGRYLADVIIDGPGTESRRDILAVEQ